MAAHPPGPASSVRSPWPFVGRAAELLEVEGILAEGRHSGVVLVGAAGVGKTRLAEECLAAAEQRGFATARVTATKAARGIPFGAVASLLPPSPPPVISHRAEMIRRMSAALVEQHAPKRVAVLIDDAHLVDDATATLVHQLATTRSAFVVATLRSAEPTPDAILALWKDALAVRIVVDGLSAESAHGLLSGALGNPVERGTVQRLVDHVRGNMLFLRELVLGAVSDGSLRLERGLWRQVHPLRPSERLVELVEARLSALTDPQRALLEVLALGEPIGRRELQVLAETRTAEKLERLGLVVSAHAGRRLQIRLAHPLYADVLRATTSALRADVVSRRLAEAVERTGARRREDALRIATWRLTCGGASSSQLMAAAHAARWSYDFDLACRLATAAVDAGGGFAAKLLAVQIAALQGHGVEAERELADLAAEATTDAERGAVALTQLDNVAFNLAKVDQALRLAEVAEAEITDVAWKDAVRAMRASFLMIAPSGGPRAAVEAAQPLLDRPTSSAKAWACFTASCSLTRLGRMLEALRLAEEGRCTHEKLGQSLEWPPWIHAYSHGEALAHLGRLAEAEALALEQYEAGIAEGSVERQAYFAWQLGTRVGERGGLNAAPIDMLATADKPVVDLEEEDFDRIMRIGLYGAVFATKAVIPWMLKGGGGAIVSISSIAGLQGIRGTAGYTCAKGALQAFARQVATDYGRAGIRSNVIITGAIASAGVVGAALEENREWAESLMRASLAKDGRLGTPDDVAEAAMYLASDAASLINGAFLPVDQGLTCLSHANMDVSVVMAGAATQAAAAGWQEQIANQAPA